MANRPYWNRGCSSSPLPTDGLPHQTATWMLWSRLACPLMTAQHPTGATGPNWMILTGETWWSLSCYRTNNSCLMLRGVYKPAVGHQNLTTFGKTTIPNIKTCCTPTICAHSFSQRALVTKEQVACMSSLVFPPSQTFPSLHIHSSVPSLSKSL